MGNLEIQIIRKEVEEKLKDFAMQVGQRVAETDEIIERLIRAMQALDARLDKLELETTLEEPQVSTREGKEL